MKNFLFLFLLFLFGCDMRPPETLSGWELSKYKLSSQTLYEKAAPYYVKNTGGKFARTILVYRGLSSKNDYEVQVSDTARIDTLKIIKKTYSHVRNADVQIDRNMKFVTVASDSVYYSELVWTKEKPYSSCGCQ